MENEKNVIDLLNLYHLKLLVHDLCHAFQHWDAEFVLSVSRRDKSRITLSIRQLEEDPLLETLDKVIPQVCKTLLYAFSQPFQLLSSPNQALAI